MYVYVVSLVNKTDCHVIRNIYILYDIVNRFCFDTHKIGKILFPDSSFNKILVLVIL